MGTMEYIQIGLLIYRLIQKSKEKDGVKVDDVCRAFGEFPETNDDGLKRVLKNVASLDISNEEIAGIFNFIFGPKKNDQDNK